MGQKNITYGLLRCSEVESKEVFGSWGLSQHVIQLASMVYCSYGDGICEGIGDRSSCFRPAQKASSKRTECKTSMQRTAIIQCISLILSLCFVADLATFSVGVSQVTHTHKFWLHSSFSKAMAQSFLFKPLMSNTLTSTWHWNNYPFHSSCSTH